MYPRVDASPAGFQRILGFGVFLLGLGQCTYDLPEPQQENSSGTSGSAPLGGKIGVPAAGGNSSGGQGSMGGQPASAGSGGASGGTGGNTVVVCEANQQQCTDGSCIALDALCSTGCSGCVYPNAEGSCGESGCEMGECLAGWVDCDKEPANGCEENFVGSADPLVARQLSDSEVLEWSGFEQYEVRDPCLECGSADTSVPPVHNQTQSQKPERADFRAVFSVGFRDDGLHLRFKVFDDDYVTDHALDPRVQDHLELVYFGAPETAPTWSVSDDSHLYVDYTGTPASRDSHPYAETISLSGEAPTLGGCRFLALRLSPAFLSGTQDPAGGYTPVKGDELVFNVGFSDFDHVRTEGAPDDTEMVERQHHVFYKNPSNNYWYRTADTDANVGLMTLVEGPSVETVPP